MVITDEQIREKVKKLCLDQGISKADIGELMGARVGNETGKYMTYYKRGDLFFAGKGAIKVGDLQRIAEKLNVTVEYFLSTKRNTYQELHSVLTDIGINEAERSLIVKQVKALSAE